MKKFILIIVALSGSFLVNAQSELSAKLEEADQAYSSGNLEEARFALQQSLAELDKLVGEEILKLLPKDVSGVPADLENDDMSGSSLGFAGVYVNRYYFSESDKKSVNIEVLTNSPFLSMVNVALTNPLLATMSGGNQKIVKIAGYKSLIEKTEGQFGEQHDVKIPVNDSMIMIECDGYTQSEASALASSLPVKEIVKLISSGQ